MFFKGQRAKIKSGYYSVRLSNFTKKTIWFRQYLKNNPKSKTLLADNEQFKQKYCGKRCFILGNGPSLKEEDLSLLKNEYVFTVNQAARMPQFKEIRSNFHFWADPAFFAIDVSKEEDRELLSFMRSIGEDNSEIHCFFPIAYEWFVKKYALEKDMKVHYFYSPGIHLYDGFSEKIDFTKPIPGFGTVVHWCITMAIYMGFSEIYILGCDNTGIIVNIKSMLHQNDSKDYAYSVSENEKKRMESLLGEGRLEAYLETYLATFRDYRRLYQYCTERNIKLVNCSAETVIDSIPRKRLKDVLDN